MEFHRGSPEASFMCHVRAMEYRTPDNWRHLLLECPRCFGPKTKCSMLIGNPPPLIIWLCVPCERAKPDIREIITANSMKNFPVSEPHQISEGGTEEAFIYWENRNKLKPHFE